MLVVNGKKVKRTDYVTKNFRYGEFASKDGATQMKLDIKAVEKLQELRDGLGVPITINSAYRSPKHNKNVGGASKSRHLQGDAFDIRVQGYTPLEIANFARYLGFSGISAYNTFTHIDTRPGGFISWGANKNKIKAKPLPKPKEKEEKPVSFRFEPSIIKFLYEGETIETLGIKRFLGNNTAFTQFIAIRDLECLGFKVGWEKPYVLLDKSNSKRKANLSMQYVIENIDTAYIKIKHNNKTYDLEGYVIYDKNGNATQFIFIKDLEKIGLKVEWDNINKKVVLK